MNAVNDYEIDAAFAQNQSMQQTQVIRKLRDQINYLQQENTRLWSLILEWKPFIDDIAKAHQALRLDENSDV